MIMQMDGTVRITIRVRKYLWKEFVYDVCSALYAAYLNADKLSKRIFNASLSMDVVYKNSVLAILLIMFGIGGLLYTVSIPIILFLAATEKIH